MNPTSGEAATPITIVPGDGDRRSIEMEYDAENRLIQFVQRGEEVFGTLEPIEQFEFAAIAAPFARLAAQATSQRRVLLVEAEHPAELNLAAVPDSALTMLADADEAYVFSGDKVTCVKHADIDVAADPFGIAVAVIRRPIRTELTPNVTLVERGMTTGAHIGIPLAHVEAILRMEDSTAPDLGDLADEDKDRVQESFKEMRDFVLAERNHAAIERVGDAVEGPAADLAYARSTLKEESDERRKSEDRAEAAEARVVVARRLLQDALAAESSATKSGEPGAFNDEQREDIANFLTRTERAAEGTGFESGALDAAVGDEPQVRSEDVDLGNMPAPDGMAVVGEMIEAMYDADLGLSREGAAIIAGIATGRLLTKVRPITPDEAKTLYAVWAGDAFDAKFLDSVQPKLEAIAGEDWR